MDLNDKNKKEGIRFVERSLLGSLIMQPEIYSNYEQKLDLSLFTSEKNATLFQIIKELYDDSEEIDWNLLTARVGEQMDITYEKLDSNYIQLADSTRFFDYLMELVEYREKSILSWVSSKIKEDLLSDTPTDIIKAEILKRLEDDNNDMTIKSYHVGDFMIETMDRLYSSMNNNGLSGIDTGINKLNERNGGWQGGDVNILAARAGLGKTTLAMNFALSGASQGLPVVIFSLEMGAEQLLMLLCEIKTGISTEDMRAGRINQSQIREIEDVMGQLKKLPLFIISGGFTIEEIEVKVKALNRKHDIRVCIIDYLQLIGSRDKHNGKNALVEDVSRRLKLLAMPNGCNLTMIILSQLNRSLESRADKRPMLSDLRDSGAIEQDADMVMMLYRDSYYDHECTDPTTELIVSKNRFGKTGIIRMIYENRSYKPYEESFNDGQSNNFFEKNEDIPF